MVDRSLPKHARGLSGVRVEAFTLNHLNAVVFPVLVLITGVVLIVVCHGALPEQWLPSLFWDQTPRRR